MKILFLVIGKTDESYLETGIGKYIKRLEHYIPFEMKVIPDIKNRKTLTEEQQKKAEGDLILSQLNPGDDLILLDEKGKTFTSVMFSQWIEKQMNAGSKRIVFVVGGPYGFSKEVYDKCKFVLSDMFENIEEKFDIIVSNPPYIKTEVIESLDKEVQNEPNLALDGGEDGLKFYKTIAENAYKYLNEDGVLALEIGYDQKAEVIKLLEKTGKYIDIYSKKDFGNNDRIVVCKSKY